MLRDLKKILASRPKPKKRAPKVRKGQGSSAIGKAEFVSRMRQRYFDPAFGNAEPAIESLAEIAWDGYHRFRKSPRVRKAGAGWADPEYKLSIEWLDTRRNILAAEKRQRDPRSYSRILLICGSSRSDQTCPGEMSKTFR